jgi:hypothetical protein
MRFLLLPAPSRSRTSWSTPRQVNTVTPKQAVCPRVLECRHRPGKSRISDDPYQVSSGVRSPRSAPAPELQSTLRATTLVEGGVPYAARCNLHSATLQQPLVAAQIQYMTAHRGDPWNSWNKAHGHLSV